MTLQRSLRRQLKDGGGLRGSEGHPTLPSCQCNADKGNLTPHTCLLLRALRPRVLLGVILVSSSGCGGRMQLCQFKKAEDDYQFSATRWAATSFTRPQTSLPKPPA